MRATSSPPLVLLCALLCTLSLEACKSKTAIVRTGPHRAKSEPAPLRVERAPPPARIEVLPLRRNKQCRYLDGHWQPQGGSWTWNKGSWILAPKGCYYAPPKTSYESLEVGTTLVFRPGAWHSRKRSLAKKSCDEPLPCPAANSDPSQEASE